MPDTSHPAVVPCLLQTWHLTESELFHWLLKQCGDKEQAFDLLQETFLRALLQKKAFCDIKNQRSWLFRVANNLQVDEWRKAKGVMFDDDAILSLHGECDEDPHVIDSLAQCLPKALDQLPHADKAIIEACDLNGEPQQIFARKHGLTLPATKSRIQRARYKLKQILKIQCRIRFDEQQRVCCFFPEK
ncbi:sigma-70 family RNA polymerase sigma factor [Vibrio aestuarianus]|uniref:sigma-70 family RNA polymerase sigma factor n=1 Tax=Vibrio aestuarianus TaxID=28171 RepID=UPI0040690CE6